MNTREQIEEVIKSIAELNDCEFAHWQPDREYFSIPMVHDKNGSTISMPLVIDWEKTRLNFQHKLSMRD